ncbi:MAG: hypothetical protein WA624_18720 [Methylocella sp.]
MPTKDERDEIRGVMAAIKPRDAFEEMVTTEIIALHGAAMLCYGRARSSFFGIAYLDRAERYSLTFERMLDQLNHYRAEQRQA